MAQKSKSFLRYSSKKEKSITFTPVFAKSFAEKTNLVSCKSPSRNNEELFQLKAEKLKTFWELSSYEDLYINKTCIRSRLSKILSIANSIANEVKDLKESIGEENLWLEKLNKTLSLEYKPRAQNAIKKHISLDWKDTWVCCKINNQLVCCQVLYNQIDRRVKLRVFAYNKKDKICIKLANDSNLAELISSNQDIQLYLKDTLLANIVIDI